MIDSKSRAPLLLAATIAIVTLLAYLPAMNAGFIWDDDDYVINNDTLRDAGGLWQIWSDPSATPQYYPIVHSTFWFEYQAWELWAPGYHIVNVLIHLLNSLLLWRLCSRLGIPAASLIGFVFAIHPVHVESVAWVTERKNVLSGFFYLSAAYAYFSFAGLFSKPTLPGDAQLTPDETTTLDTANRGPNWKLYVLSLALFVAALLSKTVTSTLPAALLLVLWWKHGTLQRKQLINLAPMFVIGIGFGLLTVWLEKHQVGAKGIDWELSSVERILIAGRAICFYAGKVLVPTNLIFTYPRWEIDSGSAVQYLFPLIVVVLIVGLFAARNRIGRGPVTAFCFFCGTLFPALGFFDVYPMRFSFVADHFQYLASIGMIVLYVQIAVAIWRRLFPDGEPRWGLAITTIGAVVTLLFALTWKQTLIYHDLETLWRDTIARNPTSWMAHNNLSALLARRGDFAESEEHAREATILKPGFADAIGNLAKAREGQGDIAGAITIYEQAVKAEPNNLFALSNLGAIYGTAGRIKEARVLLERVVKGNPDHASALGNLGAVEASEGNTAAAITRLQQSLEINPNASQVRLNLVNQLNNKGDYEAAIENLDFMLKQNPQSIQSLLAMAKIQVAQGNLEAAAKSLERVLEINPQDISAMQGLAYTYSQLGREPESKAMLEAAERLMQ